MVSKVLIVDDEPINVKLIEEILEYEDEFTCRTAINGEEALSILDNYYPDIILLDIMMPGMSGYETCRRIKNEKKHKFAKVLMISGKAMVEERLAGYEAGADDYITKPFIDDELLAKLKVFSKLKKTEEIDELKTSILQLFSHETKTPLNGILLGSQLILDSPSLPEKITDYARLIKISGERIHDLVRKILLLSNLRNNKKLSFRSQSVQRYLQELLEQVTHNIIKKCAINVSCPTDFEMTVDWKLFHEAFRSVVENAVKYSPDGGTVEIEASCNESGPSFRITDHGNGIDPSVKDKIFDEFYSQHIENHSKGTALSLAIAREIMTLHLGTLNVDSELGQGASFLFTLPPNTLSS
ncbi:MAG: hybrid sensor histidine kinase/response regulator [Proteobacteria bacterium]|nr:hybrid sensor histidine kinase/response regulator [Pseudomonadota bacterium]MBU1420504.1 hybrid sensor histidine kinase/response regulator [Pseudomonadota bacterium]MBU1456067.1 hybrid sensor histidine kinase/response regulator [Pseudomonadota bacterium]